MATKGRPTKPRPQTRVGSSNFVLPPIPVAVIRNRRIGEEIVGWVAACFLIVLLLPLLGMLYFDILEAKHEVKTQVEKVEKMTRKMEQKEREKEK